MGQLKEQDLAAFLKNRAAASNGILLYGTDDAAISTLVSAVIRAWPDAEHPLRLTAADLRDDPARLDDAFRALSLLGDRRLIIVEGCEENHARHLVPLIEEKHTANFLVLVAGSLAKASKLREAATGSRLFEAVGVYAETDDAFLLRIRTVFKQKDLAFAAGAEERFLALVGHDRSIALNELEKLALYCWPAETATIEDVDASCGDQASYDADALIAAVMDGNLAGADRVFEVMRQSGDWRQALVLLQMHVARLQALRAALDHGSTLEQAFRTAKPPVFFAQQAAITRQVRMFQLPDLAGMEQALQQATLASRQHADVAEVMVSRTVLSLARMARQLRHERAA